MPKEPGNIGYSYRDHIWLVYNPKPDNGKCFRRYFSDSRYGGIEEAHRQAVLFLTAWRQSLHDNTEDAFWAANPPQPQLRNHVSNRNKTSDITGVFYVRNSNAWVASIYPLSNGIPQRYTKSFTVTKYGPERAYTLAVKLRKDWEESNKAGTESAFLASYNISLPPPTISHASPEKPYPGVHHITSSSSWVAYVTRHTSMGDTKVGQHFSDKRYGQDAYKAAVAFRKAYEVAVANNCEDAFWASYDQTRKVLPASSLPLASNNHQHVPGILRRESDKTWLVQLIRHTPNGRIKSCRSFSDRKYGNASYSNALQFRKEYEASLANGTEVQFFEREDARILAAKHPSYDQKIPLLPLSLPLSSPLVEKSPVRTDIRHRAQHHHKARDDGYEY